MKTEKRTLCQSVVEPKVDSQTPSVILQRHPFGTVRPSSPDRARWSTCSWRASSWLRGQWSPSSPRLHSWSDSSAFWRRCLSCSCLSYTDPLLSDSCMLLRHRHQHHHHHYPSSSPSWRHCSCSFSCSRANALLPWRWRLAFRVWLCPNRLSMWTLMIRRMETLLRSRTVILWRHGLLSDFLVWLRPCSAPLLVHMVALFACYLFPFQFPLCISKTNNCIKSIYVCSHQKSKLMFECRNICLSPLMLVDEISEPLSTYSLSEIGVMRSSSNKSCHT